MIRFSPIFQIFALMSNEKITTLWEWFVKNEQKVRHAIDKGTAFEREFVVESLNDLILDMGMFSWEIGPGQASEWSLTISPNGDRKRMLQSKKIIDEAPALYDWEFHYSKPAKVWDRQFQVYDDFMIAHELDASSWSFVVNVAKDGLIDILLEASNIGNLDAYTAKTAADLVVTHEIGEASRILYIGAIELVKEMEPELQEAKAGISYLKRWVEELIRLK